MTESTGLTRTALSQAFAAIGIAPGDSVIVHSSYKSLGPVEGGPETVIDALLDAIGSAGNLMLPTFNYTKNIAKPYFDPTVVPCKTGIIPELGRRRQGAVRSLHPTHSVAVIGPDAVALTRDHMRFRSVGIGSPIDRLAQMHGKVLLLGVGHTSNTMIHLGEEYAGTPKGSWFEKPTFAKVLMPDGRIIEHEIDTSTSCSNGFGAVEEPMRRQGKISELSIGLSMCQLMRALDVIECVCGLIAERADALLCRNPDCRPCTTTREKLQARA